MTPKEDRTDKPIWDDSDSSNQRLVIIEDYGRVPKGSIFEINKQEKGELLQPVYCTVHLYGTMLKLYLNKSFVDLIRDKLTEVKS